MLGAMRFRLPLLAAAFALAACGSSIAQPTTRASAGPARSVCGPTAARTVAQSKTARIYVSAGKVYGCSSHGHASYLLGSAANCNAAAKVGIAIVSADVSAYGLQRCGVDFGTATVVVRRLIDGKRLRSFAATSRGLPEAFQSVRSLALKSDGAVAWIGSVSSVVGNRRAIEVHKADAGRGDVQLDSGSTIAPGSLRLRGSMLTWKHGTATRSATLN